MKGTGFQWRFGDLKTTRITTDCIVHFWTIKEEEEEKKKKDEKEGDGDEEEEKEKKETKLILGHNLLKKFHFS